MNLSIDEEYGYPDFPAYSLSGTLFLGGGALKDDNKEVWNRLYEAAAAGNASIHPRIAVFCSAASHLKAAEDAFYLNTSDHLSYRNLFEFYGFEPLFIPIAIDCYSEAAYSQSNIALLDSCSAVWFNGGNQACHARSLLKDDGSDTPLMQAVRKLYHRGGVIAGSSAGAAIQGTHTYGRGTSEEYLQKGSLAGALLATITPASPEFPDHGGFMRGFAFLEELDVVVDTHFGAWRRQGRLPVAMKQLCCTLGLGIDENTAVAIKDGIAQVYGQQSIMIYDTSNADFGASSAFHMKGARLHRLTSGDRFDLFSKQLISHNESIKPFAHSNAYQPQDILQVNAMYHILDCLTACYQESLSTTAENTTPQFQFIFSKEADFHAYKGTNGPYTITNVKLDILPVI